MKTLASLMLFLLFASTQLYAHVDHGLDDLYEKINTCMEVKSSDGLCSGSDAEKLFKSIYQAPSSILELNDRNKRVTIAGPANAFQVDDERFLELGYHHIGCWYLEKNWYRSSKKFICEFSSSSEEFLNKH